VNIGNPNEISLKDFAEEVLKLTGNSVKIVNKELPVDDPKQRQPDITKARTILGWEPKVERAEGLQKTYDYFKALPPGEWTKPPKEFISKKYIII
jgi:dTDP-glucose 4,6-dehydratase